MTERSSSRSYGQFCGLARALDIVGDRWSLLIVRELLIADRHYSQLRSGLGGVATNLLATRLRALEASGVIRRDVDIAAGGISYALTDWGRELAPAIHALVRWSTPLMVPGPLDDAFHAEWLAVGLQGLIGADTTVAEAVELGFRVDDRLLVAVLGPEGSTIRLDPDTPPATILEAAPEIVLGLTAGVLDAGNAIARGRLRGPRRALDRYSAHCRRSPPRSVVSQQPSSS